MKKKTTDKDQGKELEKILGRDGADGVYCYEPFDDGSMEWTYTYHSFGEEFYGSDYQYDQSDIPSWGLQALIEDIYKKWPNTKINFWRNPNDMTWSVSKGFQVIGGETNLIDALYKLVLEWN